MTTPEQFIRFFSAIPDEQWATGTYGGGRRPCCARGFIIDRAPESEDAFMLLFHDAVKANPEAVNDGQHPDYQQPTPKLRILAALNQIKP